MLSGNTIFPQLLLQEKGEGEGNSWECKFCASAGAQTVPRPGSQATEDSRVSVHTFSRKPESWPQQNKLVGWRQAAFQQGTGVAGGEDGEKGRTVSRAIGPGNWLLSTHMSHVGWGGVRGALMKLHKSQIQKAYQSSCLNTSLSRKVPHYLPLNKVRKSALFRSPNSRSCRGC